MSPIEPQEIGELLSQNAAPLELYAAQWTQHPEDCVQESFIALAALPAKPENTIAWLYRVVRNRAINAWRASSRRANHEQLAAVLNAAQAAGRYSLGDLVDLQLAIDDLTASQRELVVLRIWGQLKWNQISEITGMSKSTAQRSYAEALKKLKEILDPCPKNSNCPTT